MSKEIMRGKTAWIKNVQFSLTEMAHFISEKLKWSPNLIEPGKKFLVQEKSKIFEISSYDSVELGLRNIEKILHELF